MKAHEAYPLQWPQGWTRVKQEDRQQSRFSTTFSVARDSLMLEIERLGGKLPVLSTNVELRLDGLPYASRREPDDAGASVFFEWNGKPTCFACDRWDKVKDNIQSIRKTIEALRGIERWGASDMLDRAFAGFAAVSYESKGEWRDVLGCRGVSDFDEVKRQYRELVKIHHPDCGGSADLFCKLQKAYESAMAEMKT